MQFMQKHENDNFVFYFILFLPVKYTATFLLKNLTNKMQKCGILI